MNQNENTSGQTLEKAYDPSKVEQKVYDIWVRNSCFAADENSSQEPFCIVIPPPNVTGMLTMGHVLNNTLQDVLIRFHRMNGRETLWLPGTDHAGIATQNVVERSLAKEKISRHDLGREAFLKKVWEWKEKFGGIIISQLKKLGCSCDWPRERFTMDEGLSQAVQEAFIRLYKDGLIYKGKYIINWCPRCQTALSDEEKIPQDTNGSLWYMRYPLKDGSGHLVVATTRPETMLGDTAVAVNPKDERYLNLIGKTLVLPFVNREIPIIADDFVDPQFGTGAVKVTPAHDPNDFEMGRRHSLPQIIVMDESGTMNENAGQFKGLDRFKCRKELVEALEEKGLLEKILPHDLAVGHCERCSTVIEPYLSDQWFVRMKPLAEKAIEAVKTGKLRFTPQRWVGVYLHWMENIRDWCISRQLWWGHRIPAYTCSSCGNVTVDSRQPDSCSKCGTSERPTQDEDVLDTWFSSWLWPFSTMGWPDNTQTLKKFYPTDLIITGPDIIFFWIARMVMAGYSFMGECPFHDVYFTSIVRDMKGRKMSKSLGNSPDPLDLIAQYGADALRYTIIALAPTGQDVKFSNEKTEMGRNFANKLWNASRFVLMNLEGKDIPSEVSPQSLTIWDKWITSRAISAVEDVRRNLEDGVYRFNDALKTVYEFIWNEYCDWYIEMSKPWLSADDPARSATTRYVLLRTLKTALKLLHPFMPFVTEEIYGKLPETEELLIRARFPVVDPSLIDKNLEAEIAQIMEATRVIRNLRAAANIPPGRKLSVKVLQGGPATETIIRYADMIKHLARLESLETASGKPSGHLVGLMGTTEIYLNLAGVIDLDSERKRVDQEVAKIEKELQKTAGKLDNHDFVAKAPEHVVQKIRDNIQELQQQQIKFQTYREQLGKL